MANAGAKLSSFPEVNDIQTGDMFPLLSGGNTNAKIDYATLADAIIADETARAKKAEEANTKSITDETTRAKKAEEANTQLTNDLKTGLTSGTVKVAKATVADSASSLGKVSTYQTKIPDNGGRRKYLLMYDITDWISAKSNASTRAFDGHFFSRRDGGYVNDNYTGNLSIVASYNGVNSDGSPIKSDNGISLRLRTTSSAYVPRILHQKSNDKYYLSLMTGGYGRDLILFGIFQGTFIGTWINNEGAHLSDGTLPSDYEEYSDGFYSIPYEKAICDKNGKDITEYLVAAAYADGAFTFTRGNGSKTVLTIPDTVSNTINTHIANKSNPHGVTKAQVGLGSVVNLDQSKAIKSITRNGTTFTATALDGTTTTFTQQDSSTTYSVATSSADGLMSKTDKAKLDGISSGADASPIKTVKVNGTALTPDSNKAVNVTVPTLANNATTTAGGMALDARMGKTLADQASQFAKNTAQIETAGTATNAHSVGEYVMISNALYKVTASVAKGDTWTIGTNVTAANIGSEISSLKSDLANKLYPVGSIYMSVNATNPAELFGGTWEQIKGRFLLGVGPNDANTTDWWGSEPEGRVNAPAGELGGESWHTLTVDQMPSHAHIEMANNTFSTPDGRSRLVDSSDNGENAGFIFDLNKHPLGGWNTGTVIETMPSGGSSPHNNMPPYLAVYMWQRTA